MRKERVEALIHRGLLAPAFGVTLWGGLGDTIYSRTVLKAACKAHSDVLVSTCWPQLVSDLGVRIAAPPKELVDSHKLRTQARNIDTKPEMWGTETLRVVHARPGYGTERMMAGQSIHEALAASCRGLQVLDEHIGLPVRDEWRDEAQRVLEAAGKPKGEPYGVVRPATLRGEWECASRNPHPEAVYEAVAEMRRAGLWTLAFADVCDKERLDAPWPETHTRLAGEQLSVGGVAALLADAEVSIVPECFALPLSVAVGGNTVWISSGWLPPALLVPASIVPPGSRCRVVEPERACGCFSMSHGCDKRVIVGEAALAVQEALDGRALR